MKLKNGSVIGLDVEETGSSVSTRSGRINDRLSWEVSKACDAFFKKRGIQFDAYPWRREMANSPAMQAFRVAWQMAKEELSDE